MSILQSLMNVLLPLRKLDRVKFFLLLTFSFLLFFQYLIGFKNFDDYLIVFIFILFLNDLYYKMNRRECQLSQEEGVGRLKMSAIFFIIFCTPFVFDLVNFPNAARFTIYKFGFVIWAQVLLLNSFSHYKKTNSKQWLVFANAAILMIIVGAFIN